MPSTIHLRRKIKSVSNTKQITKAMQMVAASKMRRAQEAVTSTRAYATAGRQIMERIQRYFAAEKQALSHPLLVQRPVQRIALVVISSDRGLAGAYNGNVVKRALEFLQENQDKQVTIITIGRKAYEALTRLGITVEASFTDFPSRPTSNDIVPVAKLTIEAFLAQSCDQVTVIYTNFHSTLKQVVEAKQILPVVPPTLKTEANQTDLSNYLFEPKPAEVLNFIVPRMVELQLLQTILDSLASEHSSRMMAMKNATDNASDLIADLRLTYNSVRQASITQEIAEISAGTIASS